MTWAHAEPAIGMIAANLPALRPLLERALNFISNLTSRSNTGRTNRMSSSRPRNYMELGALRNDVDKDKGNETRIMEGYAGNDTRSTLGDNESQAEVVRLWQGIRVERSYGVRSDTE